MNAFPSAPAPSGNHEPKVRALTVKVAFTYRYLVFEPADFKADSRERRPIVFFLHGRGERGKDIGLVKKHGPTKMAAAGRRFPFFLVAPQCPDTEWWNTVALDAFIKKAIASYPVDEDRIYLTGLSMGGFATWALAQLNPTRYAAVVPVCGGGETAHAAAMKDLPIWAFHGAKDTVVPIKHTEEMVEAIRAAGGNPRFTVYPAAAHDSWTVTYSNDALYDWLLAQRRGVADPLPPLSEAGQR